MLVHFAAAAVVADAEVVASPVLLFQAIQLIDAAGVVSGSASNRARQLDGRIVIARRAVAVGIDHHQDCFSADGRFGVAIDFSIGALAGFHGIGGLSEAK